MKLDCWDPFQYCEKVSQETILFFVPQLLSTVSYTFRDTSAQVVALILHRGREQTSYNIDAMIWLGRFVNFVAANMQIKDESTKTRCRIQLVPHKRKMLGTHLIQECHGLREAQVITSRPEEGEEERLSYTYIGGGVPHQPPFSYPLVTRETSLPFADLLMAVYMFLSNAQPEKVMFVRRQNTNITKRLTPEQKDAEIEKRISAIQEATASLRDKYTNDRDLFRSLTDSYTTLGRRS